MLGSVQALEQREVRHRSYSVGFVARIMKGDTGSLDYGSHDESYFCGLYGSAQALLVRNCRIFVAPRTHDEAGNG